MFVIIQCDLGMHCETCTCFSLYLLSIVWSILWSLFSALDVASKLGGPALEPFYSLIEGGREGSFFAELEQFFYYAQIKR